MIFHFHGLCLDPKRRELRLGSRSLDLQPRVFDLIHYLVQHRDRVVSKDELFQQLWPNVVVVDGALQRTVSIARAKLREGTEAECIRTHARQGYRFVADVSETRDREEDAANPSIRAKPSIVVLPFDNLGDDPEQAYFAEGVAEDINMGLSRLRCLFVISRASALAYRGRPRDLLRISQDLGVRYILSGSVRRFVDRLRVSVELVDMSTCLQVWADRYDRKVDNVFDIQDEITGAVVASIEPGFSRFERERARIKPPDGLDAWSAYQRGVWHLHKFTREDTNASLPLFTQASELDPQFAPAWAGISFYHFSNAYLGYSEDWRAQVGLARTAAERGIGVDDQCPAAHWAMGRALLVAGDLSGAVDALQTSVELNANSAHGHYMLGWAMVLRGDAAAAHAHLDRAERLSPRDRLLFAFKMVRAMALLLDADHEAALHCASQAARQPNAHEHTLAVHVAALVACGRLQQAKAVARKLLDRRPTYSAALFRRSMPYRSDRDAETVTGRLPAAGVPPHSA